MHSTVKLKKTIVNIMVYYTTFQPHLRPADNTSVYIFVCKGLHPGIIHRVKIKYKYNAITLSHRIKHPGANPGLLQHSRRIPMWYYGTRLQVIILKQ